MPNLLNGTVLFGQELWRYLAFLGVVLAALIAAVVIDLLFARTLRRIAEKAPAALGGLVLKAIRLPVKLVVYTIGVRYSALLFSFPDPAFQNAFRVFIDRASWILIGVIVTVLLMKLADLIVESLKPKVARTESKLDDQLLPVLGKLAKILVLALMILLILQNLGYNVTSLLAGLGIGGLAVALAAQETLSNFLGSIAIFADKPFGVGDRIQVEGFDGSVESVGMRSTRLRTLDGTLATIPNSKMAHASVNNVSARPTIKKLFTLNLTYDTGREKMERALAILREIFGNDKAIETHWVYFSDFGMHSLDILCIVWCKELRYEEHLKAMERVNLEVLRRFNAEGIEFAFPTQTIYHKPLG